MSSNDQFEPMYRSVRRATHFNGVSLTSTAKLLYAYLNQRQADGADMRISNNELSQEVGVAVKTVTFNMQLLEKAGIITSTVGRYKHKTYVVITDHTSFIE